MAHLLIAAAHKSSGKTTVSVGLAGALTRRGHVVQPFKKGPDYIDPQWLGRAAARPCYNLDFNTMSHGEIEGLFASRQKGADLGLIESNKGLYDGVDLEGRDSNAALAKLLKSPVVLVIDTTGTTRGIAPLLRGYQVFDPDIAIAGVILNKVGGPRHEGKLRAAVERYTDLPVLGAVGRDDALAIHERHLGLTTPSEMSKLESRLQRLYDTVEKNVEVDQLLKIASRAPSPVVSEAVAEPEPGPPVRIGIARDSAFTYYYPDDLEAMEKAGAELVFFDTLNDAGLPDVDGLFFGGGFPETHLAGLEANRSMRMDIKRKIENGMPAYAECGGLMYLSQSLCWKGDEREMVGVIQGRAVMCARPQGRGYTKLQKTLHCPWTTHQPGQLARGFPAHEFHFARIDDLPADTKFAFEVKRGHGIDGHHDGVIVGNLLAGFCHMRHTRANPWTKYFLRHVRTCVKK